MMTEEELLKRLNSDHMFIAYNPVSNEVQQLVYETVSDGMWTYLEDYWHRLEDSDTSVDYLYTAEIRPEYFASARDHFADAIAEERATYESEYRMWFA